MPLCASEKCDIFYVAIGPYRLIGFEHVESLFAVRQPKQNDLMRNSEPY